jgi:hypothetical protein
MILFGWLQEATNPPDTQRVTMKPFWFGCIADAAPWLAIGYNLVAADQVPGFVVGIFVSLFVFFNSFALNQWLQYRKVGRWRGYLFGEKAYLVLSLVAKSALAWQIFAGSLAAWRRLRGRRRDRRRHRGTVVITTLRGAHGGRHAPRADDDGGPRYCRLGP